MKRYQIKQITRTPNWSVWAAHEWGKQWATEQYFPTWEEARDYVNGRIAEREVS